MTKQGRTAFCLVIIGCATVVSACGGDEVPLTITTTRSATTVALTDRQEAIDYVRRTVDDLAEALDLEQGSRHEVPDIEASCSQGIEGPPRALTWDYSLTFSLGAATPEAIAELGKEYFERLGLSVREARDDLLIKISAGALDDGTLPAFFLRINFVRGEGRITGSTGCWPP